VLIAKCLRLCRVMCGTPAFSRAGLSSLAEKLRSGLTPAPPVRNTLFQGTIMNGVPFSPWPVFLATIVVGLVRCSEPRRRSRCCQPTHPPHKRETSCANLRISSRTLSFQLYGT
jgi:hypothetical protein